MKEKKMKVVDFVEQADGLEIVMRLPKMKKKKINNLFCKLLSDFLKKDKKKLKIKLYYDKEIVGWYKQRLNDFLSSSTMAGLKCEVMLKQGKNTKFYRNY